MATTREELAAAATACEGRVWHKNTTQKPRARQGGAHSRAHDRRQPEKGAVERGHCPRACTPERARRREEAILSLLDHSFGDG